MTSTSQHPRPLLARVRRRGGIALAVLVLLATAVCLRVWSDAWRWVVLAFALLAVGAVFDATRKPAPVRPGAATRPGTRSPSRGSSRPTRR